MKKNKYLLILPLFLLLLLSSACSVKNPDQGKANNDREIGFKRPDFGQPDKKADVSGIVKAIVGNEVTIIKIERPERPENAETDKNTAEKNGEARNAPAFGAGTNGARIPGGGAGMGGGLGRGGNMDADAQAAMLERLKAMSTGEVTVTIPVGIKMLKPNTDSTKKMEMIEANIGDVVKDKMVNIWLSENAGETKTASFVLLAR